MKRREVHDHFSSSASSAPSASSGLPAASAFDVVVIGGGAAGLLAAGRAAQMGASILLLEKTPRLGAKLLLTGNGRCNLSNAAPLETFLRAYGPAGVFLRNAFARFFREELLALLEQEGVHTVVEADGRIFPAAGGAGAVLAALKRYVRAGGAEVALGLAAQGLWMEGGRLRGVRLPAGQQPAFCVVLATGGATYPHTGSSGDGYRWLADAGHTVHPARPALVPLETVEAWPRRLAGLALNDAAATLLVAGRPGATRRGEILFTHFGLSGPAILNLSGAAVEALPAGRVEIALNLLPQWNAAETDARLREALAQHGRQTLAHILRAWLPARLAPLLLELASISPDTTGAGATTDARRRLLDVLSGLRLTVRRPRPLREAMVTAGGLDLREVDPRTLASRRVEGLHIAGELLDLYGETGGYNLQMAFSTGYVAGEAAALKAKSLRRE